MTCPECHDSLRVRFDAPGGLARYVTCWECDRGQRIMGIGPRFHGAELDTCGPGGETLRKWDGRHPGWYLYGQVGRGKTYLAVAVCRHQAKRGRTVRLLSSARLLETIKATFAGNSDEVRDKARFTLECFAESDVVVLDDLGAELDTSWAESELGQWIDGFYERDAALVVTSNLRVADLVQRLGQRLGSRIIGMTEPLELTGPDRRMQRQPRRPVEEIPAEPEPTAEEYAATAARWLPRIREGMAELVNGKRSNWSSNGHHTTRHSPSVQSSSEPLRQEQRELLESMIRDGREDDVPGRFRAYIPEIRNALGLAGR